MSKSNRNPFQQAAIEVNCLIAGYVDEPGSSAEDKLRYLGTPRHVRFLQGNSPTGAGARGGPSKECEAGDEGKPVQLHVGGYGFTEGANLEEAKAAMLARIGGLQPAAPPPAAKPAKSKK